MTHSQPSITGTTHTLPFDKLSPRDFERLCPWLVEREEPALSLSKGYERAEHLGAAGSEQGRRHRRLARGRAVDLPENSR